MFAVIPTVQKLTKIYVFFLLFFSYKQQAGFSFAYWPFSVKLLWAPIGKQHFYFVLSISVSKLQCCGSGMLIPDSRILIFVHPGSQNPDLGSRIPDPKTATGMIKNLLSYLFGSHKYHKIENYINFELVKKKIWANLNLQRILELSTQKIVIKLSKIWVLDPRSGIQKKNLIRIPDPGVKRAPDPGSGAATLQNYKKKFHS
jgi:hypothetical protein